MLFTHNCVTCVCVCVVCVCVFQEVVSLVTLQWWQATEQALAGQGFWDNPLLMESQMEMVRLIVFNQCCALYG